MFTRGYKRDSSWVFFQTLQWPKQNAENGVIVRNLNYRPWQWIYIYIAFPVAKVFLEVFNKFIE